MEDEVRKKLLENGFELDHTMERFMGNEALYIKFLKKMSQDNNCEELVKAMEAQSYEKAFQHAHTLKGVLANLGVDKPNSILCRMVEKLRVGETDGTNEMLEEFTAAYKKSLETIDALF